jgi:hypothetical protein
MILRCWARAVRSVGKDGTEAEQKQRNRGQDKTKRLVGGALPSYVNGGVACRERDGDEPVVALDVLRNIGVDLLWVMNN